MARTRPLSRVNATLRLGTPVCVLAAELYELVTIDAGVRGHQYAWRRSVAARAIATAATPRPALARRHPATAQPSAGGSGAASSGDLAAGGVEAIRLTLSGWSVRVHQNPSQLPLWKLLRRGCSRLRCALWPSEVTASASTRHRR